jgi:hypothetical protein
LAEKERKSMKTQQQQAIEARWSDPQQREAASQRMKEAWRRKEPRAFLIVFGQGLHDEQKLLKWHLDSQKQLLLGDVYKDNWTFTNHGVEPGDEVFLMRTGKPRAPGLVGHGFATSEIYTTTHWLYPGKEDEYADVEFDVFNLIGPPVVPLATLKTLPAQKTWTPNGSGIEIRAAAATTLRWLWANATQS